MKGNSGKIQRLVKKESNRSKNGTSVSQAAKFRSPWEIFVLLQFYALCYSLLLVSDLQL